MSLGKAIAIAVLLMSLLGLCIYMNRGCFMKDPVQIYHRVATRPGAGVARGRASAAAPLMFGFSEPLRLTAVRVYRAAELMTNKSPSAIWELVSASNSIPVKLLEYGVPIRGLYPRVAEARPEPLVPGTAYVLIVEDTGGRKTEHPFFATPRQR